MDIHSLTSIATAVPALKPLQSKSAADHETFHQALASESSKPADQDVVKVSKQFEALMIGQMLKSAREASGSSGWLGNDDNQEDQTGSMVMEMGEQAVSQAMAASGGLGIAKMVQANLERHNSKIASSDSEAHPTPMSMDSKR